MRQAMLLGTLVLVGAPPLVGCAAQAGAGVLPELDLGKSDLASEVRPRGALAFGDEIAGELTEDFEYHAYTFDAAAGAELTLEITQRGTTRDLATVLVLYGPEDERGERPRLAHDFDSGWGLHSRLRGVSLEREGEHIAVVGARDGFGRGAYNLALTCDNHACRPAASAFTLTENDPNTEFMETFNHVDAEPCWGHGRAFSYPSDVAEASSLGAAHTMRQIWIEEVGLVGDDASAVRVGDSVRKSELDQWIGDTFGYDLATFEGAVGGLGESPYEVREVSYQYECAASVTCAGSVMVALVPERHEVWTLEFGCPDE